MHRKEINIITGEEKIVQLTDKEIEQKNKNVIEQEKFLEDQENKKNKKASGKQKLKDLGLDDEEINALMGA
tara:strand:- start:297 stop:509 length:213 start_codon:yes stop_codon:yes gene_type:complete